MEKSKGEIISILNYAADILPQENEVVDELEEIIHQLEEEWKEELEKEDEIELQDCKETADVYTFAVFLYL